MKWLILFSLLLSSVVHADRPISDSRQKELENMLIQDCGSCHGLTMKGGLGPALTPERLRGMPVAFVTSTILQGRPGTAMPPWKGMLTVEEANWMALYLLEMGQ